MPIEPPESRDFFRLLRSAQDRGDLDSGFSDVEFFAERFGDLRDQLAIKSLKGDDLSVEEDAQLRALDAILEEIEPEQPGLPSHVNDLVQRVLRTYGG